MAGSRQAKMESVEDTLRGGREEKKRSLEEDKEHEWFATQRAGREKRMKENPEEKKEREEREKKWAEEDAERKRMEEEEKERKKKEEEKDAESEALFAQFPDTLPPYDWGDEEEPL